MCLCLPNVKLAYCGRPGCERTKIQRDMSTPENRAFWASVEKSAAITRDWPSWMKAGINVCPTNYDSTAITPYQCGCRACQVVIDRGEM